jgi:DNA-binding MarR family transcriptional regulator
MPAQDVGTTCDELSALIDEMDAQVLALGRLLSARRQGESGAAHSHGQGTLAALTPSQVALLRAVSGEPARMLDIATRLSIKPPAVSALVDVAERAGYVRRRRDRADRRVTRVSLTEAGHAALLGADGDRREALRRHAAVLTLDDLRTLIRIQQVLIDAMTSERL